MFCGTFIIAIAWTHGVQLHSYHALNRSSEIVSAEIAALTQNLAHNPSDSCHFRALTAVAPYSMPISVYELLLTISQAIPERTFLTALTMTAHHSVVLSGFSHSKKELGAFTRALSNQRTVPCKVRKTHSTGIVGLTFTLFLTPTQEMSPSTPSSDPTIASYKNIVLRGHDLFKPSCLRLVPLANPTLYTIKDSSYALLK